MLIDFLTERYCFSRSDAIISAILYIVAAAVALFLRRWGQARNGKKYGKTEPGLWRTLLKDLPSGLWGIAFFLLTGCLKGSVRDENVEEDKRINRKIFFAGLRYTLYGTVGSYLLYTILQLLASLVGGTGWAIPLLATKALTGANLSLLWFSILPLPGSDIDVFLRKKPLSAKGEAFRKNGTWSFFLFCVLGLLLACVTVPLPNGRLCSLSGILALFPVLLIGG